MTRIIRIETCDRCPHAYGSRGCRHPDGCPHNPNPPEPKPPERNVLIKKEES